MAQIGSGRGFGKLILCGEHAVVYGHPALAFAVDRSTTVQIADAPGARTVHCPVQDPRLATVLDSLLPAEGLSVTIGSELPIGRGMGSSAALAVALVRACREWRGGPPPSAHEVFDEAMPIERLFHGNPSGLDVAVAAHGGFLWFQRGPPVVLEPITVEPRWRVVVLDTGAVGNTRELVAGVAARRPAVDPALERIGALVGEARGCLADPHALGELLTENHVLLSSIGVSTPEIDALVNLATDHGAYGAKLSGAGGGGVVIAVVDEPESLVSAAETAGVRAFSCTVGASP